MKYRFQRGDLVKNKKSITWRNQRSDRVLFIEDVGMFSGRQLVRIKWIMYPNLPGKETEKLVATLITRHSLELVASVSK